MSSYPIIPLEVIEKIFFESWSTCLSTDDRITLMISSALVNKTWSNVFTHISSKDVHIPCPSYLRRFLRATTTKFFHTNTRSPRELLCRSIHIAVENPFVYPSRPDDYGRYQNDGSTPMAETLSQLVFHLSAYHDGFPNLRTLSIEYINTGFHDVLTHFRFFRFPAQVTDLEIKFSFSPRTPPWLFDGLRANQVRRSCLYPFVPSVRRLAVVGGSDAFVTDMMKTCKNLDTLELDFPVGSAAFRCEEHRLVKLYGVNANAEDSTVSPLMRLVLADACEEVWQGVKINSQSDIYQFHRPEDYRM